MPAALVGLRAASSVNNGSGTTQPFDLDTGCTGGNTVILHFACRDTSVAGFSVADDRGNTWTIDAGPLNQSNNLVFIASTRQDVGTLQAGDTITVTAGTAMQQVRIWIVAEFSGLLTTGYVDQTANNQSGTNVGAGDAGTTGTTTQADELAVAAFCIGNNYTSANTSGWSELATSVIGVTAASDGFPKTLATAYEILSATGAQSCTHDWSGITTYQGVTVTYKAEAAAAALAPARLAGPALLTDSAATIYTSVGDSIVQVVSVSNPSGSPVNLTLSVGADAAGTRLFDAFPIPAGTQRDFRMHQPLTDGQTIQAFGSTTGVLNVTLNGRDD